MKYILMMNCPRTGYDTFGAMPKEDIRAHIDFQHSFDKDLRASGVLVSAEGLADPKQAVIVRAGKEGAPITDGVFPEAKEFLAGYWIVDVEGPEQAYAIAARASAAPGPGGTAMSIPIAESGTGMIQGSLTSSENSIFRRATHRFLGPATTSSGS